MSQFVLSPLRLEPIYQYRLWGGQRLSHLLSAPLPGDCVADRSTPGTWKSGKQRLLSTFPRPRLQRRVISITRCATLTISLVQKIGQASRRADHTADGSGDSQCAASRGDDLLRPACACSRRRMEPHRPAHSRAGLHQGSQGGLQAAEVAAALRDRLIRPCAPGVANTLMSAGPSCTCSPLFSRRSSLCQECRLEWSAARCCALRRRPNATRPAAPLRSLHEVLLPLWRVFASFHCTVCCLALHPRSFLPRRFARGRAEQHAEHRLLHGYGCTAAGSGQRHRAARPQRSRSRRHHHQPGNLASRRPERL